MPLSPAEQRDLNRRYRELRTRYSRRWLAVALLALLPLGAALALTAGERSGPLLAVFAGLFAAAIGVTQLLAARRARRDVIAETGKSDFRPPQDLLG